MWEEKPGRLNMIATECTLKSVVWSKGRAGAVFKAAAVGGADCKQQFMGHCSELLVAAIAGPFSSPGAFACSAVIPWQ